MRSLCILALATALSSLLLAQEKQEASVVPTVPQLLPDPAANTVLSSSRQFRIAGSEHAVRASVASLCEQIKSDTLLAATQKDTWKTPVSVFMHGEQGEVSAVRSVALSLLNIAGKRELRLDVHIGRGIDQEAFKRAVISAVVYDHALANLEPNETPTLTVPPWLASGLSEAIAWSRHESDRALYAALFKSGGLFKLDDLLDLTEPEFEKLDGASRAAFQVSSGALVMALLEQPNGHEGFRAFFDQVATYQGEMPALLRNHFPELSLSETSIAKWWQLQLAAKGSRNTLTEAMTIPETDATLSDALRLHFRDAEGIVATKDISSWKELAELKPEQKLAAIKPCQEAILRLSLRCFPSYRPLLAEYQLITTDLAAGKTENLDERLAQLNNARQLILAKAQHARDYLDWFEITRARQTSGAFDGYLRLKDRLKNQRTRSREDHLSTYLDRMDKVFYREGMENTTSGGYDNFPTNLGDLPPALDLPE